METCGSNEFNPMVDKLRDVVLDVNVQKAKQRFIKINISIFIILKVTYESKSSYL